MVLMQLIIGTVNLWMTGHVPKILLIASAHAISPSTIIRRVASRRCGAPGTLWNNRIPTDTHPSQYLNGSREYLLLCFVLSLSVCALAFQSPSAQMLTPHIAARSTGFSI
eukprot:2262374-Prymnesium_polylepis.2